MSDENFDSFKTGDAVTWEEETDGLVAGIVTRTTAASAFARRVDADGNLSGTIIRFTKRANGRAKGAQSAPDHFWLLRHDGAKS